MSWRVVFFPLALQQAALAQQQFAGHALVVGVDQQGPVARVGQALGDGDGVGRLRHAALEVHEQQDGHREAPRSCGRRRPSLVPDRGRDGAPTSLRGRRSSSTSSPHRLVAPSLQGTWEDQPKREAWQIASIQLNSMTPGNVPGHVRSAAVRRAVLTAFQPPVSSADGIGDGGPL